MQDFFLPARGDVQLVPIWPSNGPPSSSSHAGVANPDDMLLDYVNNTLYVNKGTSQVPSWVVASAATHVSLPLLAFRNADGTSMTAAAAAGKFGIAITLGTSEHLISEAANSNTKTDSAIVEFVLPPSYVAGNPVNVTAHCNYTLGSGTVGTHTLAALAYLNGADGTQGSTLIATSAQTVPAADAAVSFVITGATLLPGSRITVELTLVIQDTGGSNITAQVNSVAISF